MSSSLPLEKMSVEEKIQAMESIWDDLCDRADSLASPAWHGEVLADRESALQGGDDETIDWETAKQNINKQL
ncbi:MAG: addiction module protein [Gammaproteobacteria bacterium]|jgi:hypothetical protein